jgi:ribosomal-protein-alanine N-acetyltransferase
MTGAATALRPVGLFEAAVISLLHAECFDEARWDERAVTEILALPGAYGFIALEHEAPGGFVLARVAADECQILSLGVRRASQKNGLGRELLKAALSFANASKARVVHLEVAEDNTAARHLYEIEGFSVTGRQRGYYCRAGSPKIAALVLSRDLP